MRFHHVAAVAALALFAACSSNEPTDPFTTRTDPAFTFATSGETKLDATGISFTQTLADGYSETDQTGRKQSASVVLISLASLDLLKPQISLGLMGPLQPGTYAIRVFGGPLGTKQEFYASLIAPQTDGSRKEFPAASGTITITAVSPVIRGRFNFHASRMLFVPPNVQPGTQLTPTAASLDASGEFVARAP
jgi:hypothetical protein